MARTRKLQPPQSAEEWADYRWKPLAKLVYSDPFEVLIAFVIMVNAIALAYLTFPNITETAENTAEFIDLVCFTIYGVELLLRVASYGKKPWMFFTKGWNVFDFIVVAGAPLFAGQTVVLRLLRLFRLIRIFRFLPEVRVLSASIIKSLPPLLSMTALIGLLIFIFGMIGHYLFGAALPEAWGSIGASMMSLFILLTLENFPIYLEDAIGISAWAIPYFLAYVFVIVFTVLNLLIGIVLNAMDEARAEAKQKAQELSNLQSLAQELETVTADGEITPDEIAHLRAELARLRKG
jgi:voltage-gated sodium channel